MHGEAKPVNENRIGNDRKYKNEKEKYFPRYLQFACIYSQQSGIAYGNVDEYEDKSDVKQRHHRSLRVQRIKGGDGNKSDEKKKKQNHGGRTVVILRKGVGNQHQQGIGKNNPGQGTGQIHNAQE